MANPAAVTAAQDYLDAFNKSSLITPIVRALLDCFPKSELNERVGILCRQILSDDSRGLKVYVPSLAYLCD